MGSTYDNLRKALVAIEAAKAGPSTEDLNSAPLMEYWLTVQDGGGAICFLGRTVDHPLLGTQDILTSPAVCLNRSEGWLRTMSRWYRLGKPLFSIKEDLAQQFKDKNGKPARVEFDCPGLRVIEDPAIVDQMIAQFVNLVLAYDRDDLC